jgi:hypothetical protein
MEEADKGRRRECGWQHDRADNPGRCPGELHALEITTMMSAWV